jgi:hypothetical protein
MAYVIRLYTNYQRDRNTSMTLVDMLRGILAALIHRHIQAIPSPSSGRMSLTNHQMVHNTKETENMPEKAKQCCVFTPGDLCYDELQFVFGFISLNFTLCVPS